MANDNSNDGKISRDVEVSRDRSPSLVDYAENGGHAVVKTLQDCLNFMKEHPATTSFFLRTLVQTLIGKMLGRIELSPEGNQRDQRRLIAQRLTRAVIGGTMGVAGPIISATDPKLRRGTKEFPGLWTGTSPKMTWIIRFMCGYFGSDTLELLWARVFHDCPAQWDLLVHHIFGVVCMHGLFGLEHNKHTRGHWWCGTALSGESLTFLTGTTFFLTALPKGHPARGMLSSIAKYRLLFLQYLRMPLWIFCIAHMAYKNSLPKKRRLDDGVLCSPDGATKAEGWRLLVFVGFVMSLDTYWIRMLREAHRRGATSAGELV